MLPDISPVEEVIREWARAAGITVDQLVLNRRGRPVVILPLAPAHVPVEGGGRNVPLEVVKVLREAGRPMTGVLVLEALEKRGVRISKTTLDHLLARMVSDGDLQNPGSAGKPPGYRLPGED
jgi:hypothetical protein